MKAYKSKTTNFYFLFIPNVNNYLSNTERQQTFCISRIQKYYLPQKSITACGPVGSVVALAPRA